MPSSEHCPGSCNSRYRREHAIYQAAIEDHAKLIANLQEGDPVPDPPQPPETKPTYGEPVWCPRCQAIIRRELAEIDELAMSLAALPPGIRPAFDGTRERVRSARSVWAPSPSPTADEIDELYSWLATWEDYYRGFKGWAGGPARGFLADRVTSAVNWLTGKLDGLFTTPLAEPFGLETRRWHRELVAMTHSARAAKHIKKTCPRCRLYTLWEEIGKDYIRCVNPDCNRLMTREELNAPATTTGR